MTDDLEKWIENKTQAQEERQPHEQPAFASFEIKRKLSPIAKLATDLSKLKKPIEKKEKLKDKKKKGKKGNDTNTNATDSGFFFFFFF